MIEDSRPDAALGLDGTPHTGEAMTDDGMLIEPQAEDFKSAQQAKPDPDWYKRAVFYEVLVRAFYDSNGDGTGDLRGLTDQPRLPAVARRRLPLAAAVLRLAPARRRLRHPRLPRGAAGVRHRRGLRVPARRGAPARHPGDHRPGDEPHLRLAPVVPGVPRRTRDGPYGDYYVWSDDDSRYYATRGSSSSTPSRRTGRSTRCAGSSTGTGSSPTSRTSTTRTPPCRRRCSTSCGSGSTSASTGSGSTRCPTCSRRRAPTARTCRARTRS